MLKKDLERVYKIARAVAREEVEKALAKYKCDCDCHNSPVEEEPVVAPEPMEEDKEDLDNE